MAITASLKAPVGTSARPTWAEVSGSALRRNFALLRDHVAPSATVCAIVKCNAYGHGAVGCAQSLEAAGATWFGVTCAEEGIELRKAGITGRILLMSSFWRGQEDAVLEYKLTPVVWDREQIELLESAAQKAKLPQHSVAVHLKVDTGMARLGVDAAQLPKVLQLLKSARAVHLEGVLSHLASAEVLDAPDVEAQLSRFDEAVSVIERAGFSPSYLHIANSAALMTRERSWKNLVRPGISLYGYFLPLTSGGKTSSNEIPELPVKPVLSWKTRIISLRAVAAGQPLGYNGAYRTPAAAKIAALPVGYGDGLSRQLSSKGRVLVRGEFANIVGNVSMDLTLIDVTAISGAEIGDEVVILGEQGENNISAWEHARHARTIPYEILCNISARVPRVYVE